MKILYLVDGKFDIHNWSGTTMAIYNELKKYADLDVLDIYSESLSANISRAVDKLKRDYFKIYNFPQRTKKKQEYRKNIIKNKLDLGSYDAIFCIGSLIAASIPKNNTIPVYLYIDAVQSIMKNYYYVGHIDEKAYKFSDLLEKNGLEAASQSGGVVFTSSDWCRDACIRDYGIPEENVETVLIGANNLPEISANKIQKYIKETSRNIDKSLDLLFIGRDYKRKGFKETEILVNKLVDDGLDVHLFVVGCKPETSNIKAKTKVYRSLDKSNKEDLMTMIKLYCHSHFFIFPTHAECSAVVICESGSFGLPAIVNPTGGMPGLVKDGVNGFLIDRKNIQEWENKILYYVNNKNQYAELRKSTFLNYKQYLNWNIIVKKMFDKIEGRKEKIYNGK